MEMQLVNNLLRLASMYGEAKRISEATIGKTIALDGKFFSRIRSGQASFTARKYDEIVANFSRRWPDGLAWPNDIERPDLTGRRSS